MSAGHSGVDLEPKPNNRWVFYAGFLVCLMLAVFPIPPDYLWLRPQFTLLLIIYWCLMLPQAISLPIIVLLGLSEDVITLSILGQHSLALVVIAYICLLGYQRLRFRSVWQQSMWVFVFAGIQQVLMNWVHGLVGSVAEPSYFLMAAFTTALSWPVVFVGLEKIRYHYRLG